MPQIVALYLVEIFHSRCEYLVSLELLRCHSKLRRYNRDKLFHLLRVIWVAQPAADLFIDDLEKIHAAVHNILFTSLLFVFIIQSRYGKLLRISPA